LARSISCRGSNGLPTNARAAAALGIRGRLLVNLAAEHDHRDRTVALLHPLEHLPAIDAGHHDVEQHERGCLVFERLQRLVGARRLADGVALHLQVDAHELAQALVVVDDEHERPGATPAGT